MHETTSGGLRVPTLVPRRLVPILLSLGVCAGAGCGGLTKAHAAARSTRTLDASAKMLVVSAPGVLPIVEKGTLAGNFDARLTVTLTNSGTQGAQSKLFDIDTPEGSILGEAKLSSYSLGSPIVADYPASISRGTGMFAHASSTDLLFRTEASGLPGSLHDKITITVTGTVSY
jgi:hypothetical protein